MRCVSLFSGCGGLDLGIKQAGFKIVLAVENDKHCAASHEANFRNVPFYFGSISDAVKDIATGDLDVGGLEPVDLVAGGPPCPPFSKSRFYRKEKPRALDDDVGWETMNGFRDMLNLLKPRAFLLENVPGLAYKAHQEALDFAVDMGESLGYETSWKILNAGDFGVPQIRERFFLVGLRSGTFTFPEPTHRRADANDLLAHHLPPWRTAGDAIGDLDSDKNADDTAHYAGGQYHDLLEEIPPGQNYLYFTAKRGHPEPRFEWRSRYWSFLLKLSPDLPSWTIQARRSNNMGPFHWRNRILRIEEIKRLQTFPDEWRLAGTLEQQWRQVGNAVPPLMARRLGQRIRQHLLSIRDNLEDAA
jgi:DNA (cytosine-5)-methyltransferase 1